MHVKSSQCLNWNVNISILAPMYYHVQGYKYKKKTVNFELKNFWNVCYKWHDRHQIEMLSFAWNLCQKEWKEVFHYVSVYGKFIPSDVRTTMVIIIYIGWSFINAPYFKMYIFMLHYNMYKCCFSCHKYLLHTLQPRDEWRG